MVLEQSVPNQKAVNQLKVDIYFIFQRSKKVTQFLIVVFEFLKFS